MPRPHLQAGEGGGVFKNAEMPAIAAASCIQREFDANRYFELNKFLTEELADDGYSGGPRNKV